MPDTGFNLPDYGNNLFGAGGNSGGFPSMASSGNPALNTKGWLGIDGLGKNMQTLQVAGAGLQTLTGLWAALKAADIAKKQLAFTKATTNANLANQTQSYNTGISDRARARGAFEGQSNAQVADYISQNSLPKRTV
jgi:hypothetical protein